MKRRLCSAILFLEAIVLGLTTPVLISVESVKTSTALMIGLGLLVACVVVGGMLRFEWAFVLGWGIQIAAFLLGFALTTMFFLGGVFVALWATAYFLGAKIERERAQWAAEAGGEPQAG